MAHIAELYGLSYQAPQTRVRWNGTTVTRPRTHVMWILWRNLGERCACSSLRKDLGAMAYAISGTTDRGEVERHDSDAPQSSCLVGFADRCCGSDPVAFSGPCLCRRMRSTRGLLRRGSP